MIPPTTEIDLPGDESGRWRPWPVLDQCDVHGCPHRISWPDTDLVDLDTGEAFPGFFCDEHTLTYLRRIP